jgi:glycosyltransferase involved in cell wall biosynthesis
MTPLVSVVIPTFNRSADLQRAIRSVMDQTFQDLEVIVVDNNSSDNTAAVVARFDDPRISLHSIENGGIVAKSRNLGISRARGRYVAFLDSDDWWSPRKLDKCIARLEAGADVVYHHLYFVTSASQTVFRRRVRARDLKSPVFRDLLRQHPVIPQSSVVIRRDLLVKIGGVPEDPDLVAMEDFICWLSVARMTERFSRVRGTLGYYWAGGGNLSSDTRTLELLDRFEARYASEFASEGDRELPAWVSYARGRVYFRRQAYGAAFHHLSLVSGRPAPWSIKVKALVMRTSIALKSVTNRVAAE